MDKSNHTIGGQRILEHTGILSTYSAHAVLIQDDKIGIAILYNVNSFPTNAFASPQIRDGLISLLTGKQPVSGWMNVQLWGGLLGFSLYWAGFWQFEA